MASDSLVVIGDYDAMQYKLVPKKQDLCYYTRSYDKACMFCFEFLTIKIL